MKEDIPNISYALMYLDNLKFRVSGEQQEFVKSLAEKLRPHARRPLFNLPDRQTLIDENLGIRKKITGRDILSDKEKQKVEEEVDAEIKARARANEGPTREPLSSIKSEISAEVGKAHWWQFQYKKGLNTVLKSIEAVENEKNKIATVEEKASYSENAAEMLRYTSMRAELSRHTLACGGEIVLPISQGLDYRIGDSLGECYGIFSAWSKGFLDNTQAPFGVRLDKPIPFKPVDFDSPVGRKYPDLNQLAILTPEMAQLQESQSNPSKLSGMQVSTASSRHFLGDGTATADRLIKLANEDKNVNKVYGLSVYGPRGGHQLGFKKDKDGYFHFLDPNADWVRFKSEADFKKWLPGYFKHMSHLGFYEYKIEAFQLPQKLEIGDRVKHSLKEFGYKAINQLREPISYFYNGALNLRDTAVHLRDKFMGGTAASQLFPVKGRDEGHEVHSHRVDEPMDILKKPTQVTFSPDKKPMDLDPKTDWERTPSLVESLVLEARGRIPEHGAVKKQSKTDDMNQSDSEGDEVSVSEEKDLSHAVKQWPPRLVPPSFGGKEG